MSTRPMILTLITLVLSVSLVGATPDPSRCTAQFLVPSIPVPVSIIISPQGGTLLTEAYGSNGQSVDATIEVVLWDTSNPPQPEAGFPQDSIRIQCADGAAAWCDPAYFTSPPHAPFYADGPTDLNGTTTFSLNYYGVSCNSSGLQVEVEIGGVWYPIDNALPIWTRGADGSGDGVINLTDIALFSGAISVYNPCFDLNNDGVINLSDIARFGPLYAIPPCPMAP